MSIAASLQTNIQDLAYFSYLSHSSSNDLSELYIPCVAEKMNVIIRLQNLPWAANAGDIRSYFHGLSIPDGGVHIVGGEQGDAFIAFSTDEDARQAMQRDGGKLKEVMIKLLLSSRTEMTKVIEQARQQALSLQQIINPPAQSVPTSSAPQITNQVELNNTDKEKDDEEDLTTVDKDKREKRRSRSRSRSRSRGRDRDRSRDRSRERDRSRDRRRDRRRRDRSRSRERYRSRRDRSRDRRDRSRDRDYKSSRNRDARNSTDNKKEMSETSDSQKIKPLMSDPVVPNKVLLSTPSVPPLNQSINADVVVESFSCDSSSSNNPSVVTNPSGNPMNISSSKMVYSAQNVPDISNAPELSVPPKLIPPEIPPMIPGFPGSMMFPGIPAIRSGIPQRDGWFPPGGPQSAAMALSMHRLPMMPPPEMMPLPTFPTAANIASFATTANIPWNMPPNINQTNLSESNCCIEIHGISSNTVYLDIVKFFEGFPIEQGGIKMINDTQGNRTGIAYIKFNQPSFKQSSLMLNGKLLNGSTVDIMHLKDSIFESAVDNFKPAQSMKDNSNQSGRVDTRNGLQIVTNWQGTVNNIQDPRQSSKSDSNNSSSGEIKRSVLSDAVVIQGLPAKCSDRDIFDFFSELGIAPIHIHILQDSTGNPTGDAFCQFESSDHALRASLKNNSNMGRSSVTVRIVNKEDAHKPSQKTQEPTKSTDSKPVVQREKREGKRERVSRFDKPESDVKDATRDVERNRDDWSERGSNQLSGSRINDPRQADQIVASSGKRMDPRQNQSTDSGQSDSVETRGLINQDLGDESPERGSDPRANDPRTARGMDSRSGQSLDPRSRGLAADPRANRNTDPRSERPPLLEHRGMDPRGGRPPLLDSRGRAPLLEPRGMDVRGERPHLGSREMNLGNERMPFVGQRNMDQGGERASLLGHGPRGMDPRGERTTFRGSPGMDSRCDKTNEMRGMDPRSDRPRDPRTTDGDMRSMRNNAPRDGMDPRGNRNMDPRQRNMDPRVDRNMDSLGERFMDQPADFPMDPRDMERMDKNMDFPMEMGENMMDGKDFPRAFRGKVGRPYSGDGMRDGSWSPRNEWGEHGPPDRFGRGWRGRGRGRGRGDFIPRGRGVRGGVNRPPLLPPGSMDSVPFLDDDVLMNFGDRGCVVAVENLHFKASVEDIIGFFRDFGIEYEDVIRRFDDLGRPTGDARVAFKTPDEARNAVDVLSFQMMMGRTIKLHILP